MYWTLCNTTDVPDSIKIQLRFGLEQDTTSTEELDFNVTDNSRYNLCTTKL